MGWQFRIGPGAEMSPLFTTIGMPNGRRGGRKSNDGEGSRASSDYVGFGLSGRFSRETGYEDFERGIEEKETLQ